MQKKDRKQGKIGTSYREALMLPYKWRYTFSCLVLIVALGAWSGVWGQDGAESDVIKSGGFEEGSFLYWDQSPQTDSVLIQRVGPESAHGGVAIARLGGVPRASDSLDQFVGALGAYAGSATLSFYWKSDNAKPQDLLSIEFVDMGSGQAIPPPASGPPWEPKDGLRSPFASLRNSSTSHPRATTGCGLK